MVDVQFAMHLQHKPKMHTFKISHFFSFGGPSRRVFKALIRVHEATELECPSSESLPAMFHFH